MNRRKNYFVGFWSEVFQWNTEKQLNFAKLWNWRLGCPQKSTNQRYGRTSLLEIHLSLSPSIPASLSTLSFAPNLPVSFIRDAGKDFLICRHSSVIRLISVSLLENPVLSFHVLWPQWTRFPVACCFSEASRKMSIPNPAHKWNLSNEYFGFIIIFF